MCSIREMDYLFHDIAYTFRVKDIVKSLMFMYGSDYIQLVEYDETGLEDSSYSDGDDDDDGESKKSSLPSDNGSDGNDDDDTKSSANKSQSNSLSSQIYVTLLLCLLTIFNYS
jgi:hypothetical protein